MALNPELERYRWLEFSNQRVIAMPVVLVILFFLASQTGMPQQNICNAAATVFLLLTILWGGRKASEAVLEEVNDNTWDFQRLSSMSPWTLTLGKLFGSTCYTWYGAMLALLVYVGFGCCFMTTYDVCCNTLLLLCSGLMCQATALHASLQQLQEKVQMRSRLYSLAAHGLGIVFGLMVWGARTPVTDMYGGRFSHLLWYNTDYPKAAFGFVVSFIFLFWFVMGIYWQMRRQLRMSTGPVLWTAFVLFLMLFCAGFEPRDSFITGRPIEMLEKTMPVVAFSVGIILLYGMVFMEPWNGIAYRRIRERWQKKVMPAFIEIFPRWLITYLLTVLAVLWVGLSFLNLNKPDVMLVTVTVLCFATRDIAMLHYFKLHPQNRRASYATLFYMGLLYILCPLLFNGMHFYTLAALFIWVLPPHDHVNLTAISSALQAGFVLSLAYGRWKRYWQS